MNEATLLAGKTALVTGASRGFGRSIAYALRAAGADLILAARDETALHATATDLAVATGPRIRPIAVDLSLPGDVDKLIDFCLEVGDCPQIIVNNAAIQGPIGYFSTLDFDAWRAVMEVNFFAPARICQRLIEPISQKKWGKIINVSGGGATSPRPDFSAYASSKCALVRLSESLAIELSARSTGIDINCVAPGAMNTRMLDELLARGPSGATREYEKALKQKQAGGASPDKAAELVVFLASPASDGITGRLFSAVWDPWQDLPTHREELAKTDIYTLRRIVPEDRGRKW